MIRSLAFAAAALLAAATLITPAFADTVTVPVGDWITSALPIVALVLLLIITAGAGFVVVALLPHLPPWAQATAQNAVKLLLSKYAGQFLNAGIQWVAGAVKGKELKIEIANPVIAKAIEQAILTLPKWLVDYLGGIDGIKHWLITEAEDHGVILPTDSSTTQVLNSPEVLNAVAVASSQKRP